MMKQDFSGNSPSPGATRRASPPQLNGQTTNGFEALARLVKSTQEAWTSALTEVTTASPDDVDRARRAALTYSEARIRLERLFEGASAHYCALIRAIVLIQGTAHGLRATARLLGLSVSAVARAVQAYHRHQLPGRTGRPQTLSPEREQELECKLEGRDSPGDSDGAMEAPNSHELLGMLQDGAKTDAAAQIYFQTGQPKVAMIARGTMRGFISRTNGFRLRTPLQLDQSRRSVSKEAVKDFLVMWRRTIADTKPELLFNADESMLELGTRLKVYSRQQRPLVPASPQVWAPARVEVLVLVQVQPFSLVPWHLRSWCLKSAYRLPPRHS